MSTAMLLAGAAPDAAQNVWNLLGFIVGAAGLIGSVLTAFLGHHRQGQAVKVDRFEAITNALDKRIADLETSLADEKKEHEQTRSLLRISLRYIRTIVLWAAGPRTEPLPETPDELLDHIL